MHELDLNNIIVKISLKRSLEYINNDTNLNAYFNIDSLGKTMIINIKYINEFDLEEFIFTFAITNNKGYLNYHLFEIEAEIIKTGKVLIAIINKNSLDKSHY